MIAAQRTSPWFGGRSPGTRDRHPLDSYSKGRSYVSDISRVNQQDKCRTIVGRHDLRMPLVAVPIRSDLFHEGCSTVDYLIYMPNAYHTTTGTQMYMIGTIL
jgi:hypothetical protein